LTELVYCVTIAFKISSLSKAILALEKNQKSQEDKAGL